jgi:BirA family biotin operon repressor/biotin-[acetyl-CoA-carboxylase] ligase
MFVIGVGINLDQLTGEGFSTPPAALSELRLDLDAPGTLELIAPALINILRAFEQEGFAPLVNRYAARDVLKGLQVQCSDGVQGLSLGVASNGALRLRLPDGSLHSVVSAEISVRTT